MGAAAVFETAAETPPTVDKKLATVPVTKKFAKHAGINCEMTMHPEVMIAVMQVKTYSRNRP